MNVGLIWMLARNGVVYDGYWDLTGLGKIRAEDVIPCAQCRKASNRNYIPP